MALSEEQKNKILADYHTNTFSQRELSKKHGVGVATINRLTKGIEPKNGTLIESMVDTTIKKTQEMEHFGTLETEQQISVLKVVDDRVRRENLINGNAEKLAKKLEVMTEQIDTPSDLKTLAEANDKLAVTLKVAERHANSQVTVNTQTNVQASSNIELTEDEAKQKAIELGVPLSALT